MMHLSFFKTEIQVLYNLLRMNFFRQALTLKKNYAIPEGVDLKNYPSVVIWCQQFGVLISPADLTFEQEST